MPVYIDLCVRMLLCVRVWVSVHLCIYMCKHVCYVRHLVGGWLLCKAWGLRMTASVAAGGPLPNPLQLFQSLSGLILTGSNIWSLSGKNKTQPELAESCQHPGRGYWVVKKSKE